ncbi:class I adenylate-forming enzyme family protein [Hellea sp.]|nr:class I adenylate-forming enzyme family protein [Hellea sp.]MDA8888255.1 acyl--CoA ligase [Hellea sp.]MDB4843962.1 acyl--CoA ligase [Hellea sp.]MDC0422420.1 acyl--CoA ligase [Hellea sp.]MDC1061673.1 class I adenylate-forming enzyme family protein [Hellea sp.]MDC1088665.1 class I adenylate-forming enzyme family protein [Hellea sp.]
MNIYLILQMAAEAMGDREAVKLNNDSITYSELNYMSKSVASLVKNNEKIGFLSENNLLMPAALFGAAIAGVEFVPLNYRLSEEQLNIQLKRISPAILFTDQDIKCKGIKTIGITTLALDNKAELDNYSDDEAVAVELFTSGTTGEPKSAVLKHKNLMAYILGTVEFMSAGAEESVLLSVPPYHIAGIAAVLSSSYSGRKIVQLPNFSAEAWMRLVIKEKITNAFLVPTMLKRIVEKFDDNLSLPSLKNVAYGGGKMPRSVIERAMKLLPHVNFTNAYGLTETSATICMLGPEDHRSAFNSSDALIKRRLSSAGRPIPSIELIIKNDEGNICLPEELGNVWVRGEQVSGEYKGIGSKLDSEGWFPTKDRGFLDSDGYLFIDGRADDVIVRGGENISPGEIEDVVRTHPNVEDVAAVAVKDIEWGEAVGLVIVASSPIEDDEIIKLVRTKLRSSRVPSIIKYMDELPYNETGKLLRRVIRDNFAD